MPRGVRSHARDAIQAYEIIIKLQDYVMATPADAKVMLSTAQVNAMKILLNKCIPDIKMVEITGEEGKELAAINVNFVSSPKHDDTE